MRKTNTPQESPTSAGKKAKAALLVVIACALLGAFLAVRNRGTSEAKDAPSPNSGSAVRRSIETTSPESVRAPAVAVEPILPPVVIDAVKVDKSEVCRGEEVTVAIEARATDGRDDYLNYAVAGRPELVGPRFSLILEQSSDVEKLRVFARGKGGVTASAGIPAVRVKDCEAPLRATIAVGRRAEAMDRAWLRASVVAASAGHDGHEFRGASYEWDFGDGKTTVTPTPDVEHSYEGRAHTSAYSYFLVAVTITDQSGRKLRASKSLRFVNLGFFPLESEQRVVIFTALTTDAEGRETVSLYHGATRPVRIDRVTVVDMVQGSSGEEVRRVREENVFSLLGFTELRPGETRATRDLSHLLPSDPSAVRTLEISGRTSGGWKAEGALALMAPGPTQPAEFEVSSQDDDRSGSN